MNKKKYKDLFILFSKLGIFAFGGPAAHIAMMEEEIVQKRQWLTKERFIDMFGLTNLIPGPNSTEMAIMIGYQHGGIIGLVVAGVCFIFPAVIIVLGFAFVYVNYGYLPAISNLFLGVKPVVLAIIVQALYRLSTTIFKKREAVIIFMVVLLLSLFGISEVPLLFSAGLLLFAYRKLKKSNRKIMVVEPMSILLIFLVFLKIGSVLYGSGYVLLSFLNTEFVLHFGAITAKQLLDAVAVGQFTPGPVFTTATFIGYLLDGLGGAIAATIGIFLPSFIFVAISFPFIDKLRNSKNISIILDGVNAASLALMASVSLNLGIMTLISWQAVLIFGICSYLLIKYKINATYLIIGGAVIGLLL